MTLSAIPIFYYDSASNAITTSFKDGLIQPVEVCQCFKLDNESSSRIYLSFDGINTHFSIAANSIFASTDMGLVDNTNFPPTTLTSHPGGFIKLYLKGASGSETYTLSCWRK